MNDHLGKDHTQAYTYLKAVADRLHGTWVRIENLTGRSSDDLRDSVARSLCRDWDDAVVKALQSDYSPEDVRAAFVRLKDGKKWLKYLDTASTVRAA